MKVFLVRHGETDYNAQGIFQGYSPVPLSARGRQQAALVAERLLSLQPQVLYSSDIWRAQETANIIGQRLGLDCFAKPQLWYHRGVNRLYDLRGALCCVTGMIR